jgi:hypothetical protein
MPWLTEDIADNLLGNARPKSYASCREDDWWNNVFERWWQEGANGKPMYQAVSSLYNDLAAYYAGQGSIEELHYNWIQAPSDTALIDASSRKAFADAIAAGTDPEPALERLWYAASAQMDQVYVVFYEDVGMAKEQVRREGVLEALDKCFPSL